ncbi:MAG: L-2-amino-thiazoline-4-carboxylic acid hydrolase [Candidatus Kapabacteria bacterium]|nr:L-2-amino-thiazoline-4-carboxylic acid hydrolase [Candidatus Kapabacteria bacterium]
MKKYQTYFTKHVKNKYPNGYVTIIQRTENHYNIISADTEFAKTSKNPIDRRLDFCAYFLALIKTLDEDGESFESIRAICLDITIEYVQPKNILHGYFKRLLPTLTNTWLGVLLINAFHNKVRVNNNPNGFIANIITDKQETFGIGYGFDIIECGICKLFTKHNYAKYSSILCEVDEITSGISGLKLFRTGTIANGAEKCDFRFQRLSNNNTTI